LRSIPEEKIREILALKQRIGLPDARIARSAEQASAAPAESAAELERMVERVVARLEERK
jgi:hypothetical protein